MQTLSLAPLNPSSLKLEPETIIPRCSYLEALVEVHSQAKRERKKPSDMEQAECTASRVRMYKALGLV